MADPELSSTPELESVDQNAETVTATPTEVDETARRAQLAYYAALRTSPANQQPHGNGIHMNTWPPSHR